MATLNPQEEFVIARQLNDASDVNTYYVRAVVRNAKTDAIITTLNMVDKGSQRFTKTWIVPADPTGLGLYITITSTVYTDSGYTTKSTVYGVEQSEHLIQDRINPFLNVGPDISYKKIREIVQDELSKLVIPDPEKFDYETLAKGFESVITEVRDINIPIADLKPVVSAVEAVRSDIKAIKIPEIPDFPTIPDFPDIPEVDLSPVLKGIEELKQKEVPPTDLKPVTDELKQIRAIVDSPQIEADKKKEKAANGRRILKEYLNGR